MQHGFQIVKELAITPMPASVAAKSFDYEEMTKNKFLSEKAEDGYCFYIDAIKP